MSPVTFMSNRQLVEARNLFLDILRGSERLHVLLGVVDPPSSPVVELLERVEAEMARRQIPLGKPVSN